MASPLCPSFRKTRSQERWLQTWAACPSWTSEQPSLGRAMRSTGLLPRTTASWVKRRRMPPSSIACTRASGTPRMPSARSASPPWALKRRSRPRWRSFGATRKRVSRSGSTRSSSYWSTIRPRTPASPTAPRPPSLTSPSTHGSRASHSTTSWPPWVLSPGSRTPASMLPTTRCLRWMLSRSGSRSAPRTSSRQGLFMRVCCAAYPCHSLLANAVVNKAGHAVLPRYRSATRENIG
mmetsp:Transcript_17657/g.44431  ORF Transcript_17657/g.44431 Transcript_17657/m.44431 type:complete len:236 (-) Transcript_17657:129-836(-)